MTIEQIRKNAEISKEHIEKLEAAGLKEHVLSLQRDYVEHVNFLLGEIDKLRK